MNCVYIATKCKYVNKCLSNTEGTPTATDLAQAGIEQTRMQLAAAKQFFASCTVQKLTSCRLREIVAACTAREGANFARLANSTPAPLHNSYYLSVAYHDVMVGFPRGKRRKVMLDLVTEAVHSYGASGLITVDLYLADIASLTTPDGEVGLVSRYIEGKQRGARDSVKLRATMLREATDAGWQHDLSAEDVKILSSWMFWATKCERAVADVIAAFDAYSNVYSANGTKIIAVTSAECPGIEMPFTAERFNDEARVEIGSQLIVQGSQVTTMKHFVVIAATLTGQLFVYDPTAIQYAPRLATTSHPIPCVQMPLTLQKDQVLRLLRKVSTLAREIAAARKVL